MKDSANRDAKLYDLYVYSSSKRHFVEFGVFHRGPKEDLVKIVFNLMATNLYVGAERFSNPSLNSQYSKTLKSNLTTAISIIEYYAWIVKARRPDVFDNAPSLSFYRNFKIYTKGRMPKGNNQIISGRQQASRRL